MEGVIIWCAGMIRSGSTLQYNLAKDIVAKTGTGGHLHANMKLRNAVRRLAPHEEWWVTKSHVYQGMMKPISERGQAKFLMVYRDLRDVMVSTMKFRKVKFDAAIGVFREETVGRERSFLDNIPSDLIYRTRYEEMILDLESEVLAIADHIEVDITNKQAKGIAEANSLDSIKKFTSGIGNFDAHTRYAPRHIYTGSSGKWKEILKPHQIVSVEEEVGDWLVENGYELSGS